MSEDLFTLANSLDPDEMPHDAAFHWFFTVCKSTCLGVSHIEGVNT